MQITIEELISKLDHYVDLVESGQTITVSYKDQLVLIRPCTPEEENHEENHKEAH